jgi:hypothetical protein
VTALFAFQALHITQGKFKLFCRRFFVSAAATNFVISVGAFASNLHVDTPPIFALEWSRYSCPMLRMRIVSKSLIYIDRALHFGLEMLEQVGTRHSALGTSLQKTFRRRDAFFQVSICVK